MSLLLIALITLSDYIEKYSKELSETFSIVKSLVKEWNDLYFYDLFYLGRISNFFPLLIKTYKFDESKNKNNLRRVIRLLEIISFRVYGIQRKKSYTGKELLYKLAQNFSGDFKKLCTQLKDFIGKNCSDIEFEEKLRSPNFYKNIPSNEKNYLFWKYENYIRIYIINQREMNYREYGQLSIEHIIPQEPRNSRPWMDDNFRKQYLHSIGNLTLDTQVGNSAKLNHDFEYKNENFYKKPPFQCQNEVEDFLNPISKEWDVQSIEKRTDKIVDFALANWDYRDIYTWEEINHNLIVFSRNYSQ